MPFAFIKFLTGGGGGSIDNTLPDGSTIPTDPSYGQGTPLPPYVPGTLPPIAGNPLPLPPLPGVNPPPTKPGDPPKIQLPIHLPPGMWPPNSGNTPAPPITVPLPPDNTLPPGVYPPLPPDSGVSGKVAILVWVVGVGHRWFVYDAGAPPSGPK